MPRGRGWQTVFYLMKFFGNSFLILLVNIFLFALSKQVILEDLAFTCDILQLFNFVGLLLDFFAAPAYIFNILFQRLRYGIMQILTVQISNCCVYFCCILLYILWYLSIDLMRSGFLHGYSASLFNNSRIPFVCLCAKKKSCYGNTECDK